MSCVDTGSELVLAERAGALGVITLNRPAAVNALNLEMVEATHRARDTFAADDAVHAVLLHGAGERGLCAGGDVRVIYRARSGILGLQWISSRPSTAWIMRFRVSRSLSFRSWMDWF
ncbi:enoyl-CoA hydratase/isomerase family protein [Pseudoglutamicibacter cumminsii]|uniref:enoyl-CoA hydratase/isomerase family protein n=1 Tax=Pseudoglutamicibacter cumminsii TaxID=156979 RepID=UPI002ABB7363|nr:enoyl-CoA hydratase/isomerase family protein [Pseudoglutamicibacter cumminsii]MDZ3745863.1 enoyl-CoA hydratase/isomerase family protein [Pseudoglutamicibacter cumminsii]